MFALKASEIIKDGRDPKAVKAALDELQSCPGWRIFVEALAAKAADCRVQASKKTIDYGEPRQLAKHNENVITAKVLDCIPQLVEDTKAECVTMMKNGRR